MLAHIIKGRRRTRCCVTERRKSDPHEAPTHTSCRPSKCPKPTRLESASSNYLSKILICT